MKKSLGLLVVIVGIIVALFFLMADKHEPPVQTLAQSDEDSDSIAPDEFIESQGNDQITTQQVQGLVKPAGAPNRAAISPEERIRRLYETEISFWGKVTDQDGLPVKNARVFVRVDDEHFGSGSTDELATDSDGRFSITWVKGAGIYISVSKDGYKEVNDAPDGINSSKTITYIQPTEKTSPLKPEVFRLISKETLPHLITNESRFKIAKSGQIQIYEVKGSSAEILLSLDQDKDASQSVREWPWEFEMEGKDGGLLERENNSDYFAPENGYRELVTIDMTDSKPVDIPWQKAHFQSYFMKLPDDKYGILDIRLFAETGFIIINTKVNPAGAKNITN